MVDGQRTFVQEKLSVIPFTAPKAAQRHGVLPNGGPRPYKGYKGDSNYCIEIVRNDKGKWEGEVISTYQAYQVVRAAKTNQEGIALLRNPSLSLSGKPLVMRLIRDDLVRLKIDNQWSICRINAISGNGQMFMAPHNEANVDARNRSKEDPFSYTSKTAGSLFKAEGRLISISPIGDLCCHKRRN